MKFNIKKWDIVWVNDQLVFESNNPKIRPFLVIDTDRLYLKATCMKISSHNRTDKPAVKINFPVARQKNFVYIYEIYMIEIKSISRTFAHLPIRYQNLIKVEVKKWIDN